jgi:hypothetical protein
MRTRTRRADHTLACEPSESFGEIEGPHYRKTPECPGDVDDVRPWFVLNRDTLHRTRPLRRSRRSVSTISLLGREHSPDRQLERLLHSDTCLTLPDCVRLQFVLSYSDISNRQWRFWRN